MWKCNTCGEMFVEPTLRPAEEEDGTRERVYCCPKCKSADIEELPKCALCGSEMVRPIEMAEGTICGKCYNELLEDVKKLVVDQAEWYEAPVEMVASIVAEVAEDFSNGL